MASEPTSEQIAEWWKRLREINAMPQEKPPDTSAKENEFKELAKEVGADVRASEPGRGHCR